MKTKFLMLAFAVMVLVSANVFAESATLYSAWTFINGGVAYVQTTANLSACNTTVFKIDLTKPDSKGAYATALTAIATNKKVDLSITDKSCIGWGTELQAIGILAQ